MTGSSHANHQPRKCLIDTLKVHLIAAVCQLRVPSSRYVKLTTEHTRPQSYTSHSSGENPKLGCLMLMLLFPSFMACLFFCTDTSLSLKLFSISFLSALIFTQLYPNRQPGVFVSIRSNQDSHNPCNQYIIASVLFSYRLRSLCTDYHWGLLILVMVPGSVAGCSWGSCGRFSGWV